MTISVRAKNLVKRFGKFTAVDDISFEVGQGEVYGFLGANGAGKTTTIRMLCGLLEPTSGDAWVAGFSVKKDPEHVKKMLGYMSQKFSLYTNLTVEENIDFYAGLYGMDDTQIKERMEELVKKTGLKDVRKRIVNSIPGGVKQRVSLACALVHKPNTLFLDEPTAGVDPILRRMFWQIIRELSQEGATVFVTTHYMDEVEHCSRIALMNEGKIIKEGSINAIKKDVFKKSVYEVETQDIIRAFNTASAQKEKIGEVSMHGAMLHVIPKEQGIRLLLSYLKKAGIKSGSVNKVEPTMEDVFVKLVRD